MAFYFYILSMLFSEMARFFSCKNNFRELF